MPFSMDGSLGTQAEKVQKFTANLSRYTDVPLEYRDERLTTVTAKRMVRQVRKSVRGARYDAAAAALILQSYLDDSLLPKEYGEDDIP